MYTQHISKGDWKYDWIGCSHSFIHSDTGLPWQLPWIRLQCRRPWFNSWAGKIPWRRGRLPTSVFLGFPCGLAGKESACNTGDLGLIPGLGRSPEERLPTPVFWPGEFHGLYSPWGHKESDTTGWLSLSLSFRYMLDSERLLHNVRVYS